MKKYLLALVMIFAAVGFTMAQSPAGNGGYKHGHHSHHHHNHHHHNHRR